MAGTAYILGVATFFGAAVGLAWAGRRRAWTGWRQVVPRGLSVVGFVPFGVAGGFPLMVTVLIFTLSTTHHPVVGVWVVAALALLVSLGTDIGLPLWAAGAALAGAVLLSGWTGFERARHPAPWPAVTRWVSGLGRAALKLLALGGLVFVARDILGTHPLGWAAVYILLYLALLYPLYYGLRLGLGRWVAAPPAAQAGGLR